MHRPNRVQLLTLFALLVAGCSGEFESGEGGSGSRVVLDASSHVDTAVDSAIVKMDSSVEDASDAVIDSALDSGVDAIVDTGTPLDSHMVDSQTPPSGWDVTARPPRLVNPIVVEFGNDEVAGNWPAYSKMCAGKIYHRRFPEDRDVLMRFVGTEPLKYPLWVIGGKNVRMIGFDFDLAIQPGCEEGALPTEGGMTVHPRLPGGMAVRVENVETSFLEGFHIEMNSIEADCVVLRNAGRTRDNVAMGKVHRNYVMQNSRCVGFSVSKEIHSDLFQNQGTGDVMNHFTIENVTVHSASEGIILQHRMGEAGAQVAKTRRYYYTWDRRFAARRGWRVDGPWGLAYVMSAAEVIFDDVYIDDYRDGSDYGLVMTSGWAGGGQWDRFGNSPSSSVTPHPEIHSGAPPEDFAPRDRVGIHYHSPHD